MYRPNEGGEKLSNRDIGEADILSRNDMQKISFRCND